MESGVSVAPAPEETEAMTDEPVLIGEQAEELGKMSREEDEKEKVEVQRRQREADRDREDAKRGEKTTTESG